MNNYKVFTRNWWKINQEKDKDGELLWPEGKEPSASERKTHLGYADTEEQARAMCKDYNDKIEGKPNKLGRMAEYKSIK